jgi:hypothetical protein
MAFRMAATTLLNSKSYLGGRYRHLRKQLPSHAPAIKAMARYLAVLVYRLLTHGQAWVDRGAARFEQKRSEWEMASLNAKARARIQTSSAHSSELSSQPARGRTQRDAVIAQRRSVFFRSPNRPFQSTFRPAQSEKQHRPQQHHRKLDQSVWRALTTRNRDSRARCCFPGKLCPSVAQRIAADNDR